MTQRQGETAPDINGQAERATSVSAPLEGSGGDGPATMKQLEEQRAYMQKRAEERKDVGPVISDWGVVLKCLCCMYEPL